jgi:hypothetical protein
MNMFFRKNKNNSKNIYSVKTFGGKGHCPYLGLFGGNPLCDFRHIGTIFWILNRVAEFTHPSAWMDVDPGRFIPIQMSP